MFVQADSAGEQIRTDHSPAPAMTHINLERSPNPDSKITPEPDNAQPGSDIPVLIGRYHPPAQSSATIHDWPWTNLSKHGGKIQPPSESAHLLGQSPGEVKMFRVSSQSCFCLVLLLQQLAMCWSHPVSRSSLCPDAVFQMGQSLNLDCDRGPEMLPT